MLILFQKLVTLAVLLPIAGIWSSVFAIVASLSGFGVSLAGNKNPYVTYVDLSPIAQGGTRRHYFFGPGYHQIKTVAREASAYQQIQISALNVRIATLEAWLNRQGTGFHGWVGGVLIVLWFFKIAAFGFTHILGIIWLCIFTVILGIALLVGMTVFIALFGPLFVADRLYLLALSISSRCDSCKHRATIPVFACPVCVGKHLSLTPGPYGVFRRKCICGESLPTTIFFGRSKLDAYCPRCESPLAASDARQYGIQLVGGTNAGKTTFLASFWHQYQEVAARVPSLETEQIPSHAFDDLDTWFKSGVSGATAETNANMYSVIHHLPKRPPLQFSLYDIAGEAFRQLDYGTQQRQLQYCEGIVFIIDPTDSGETNGDALTGFLDTFRALRGKSSTALSCTPAAIAITKADLFKREIGLVKIKAVHKTSADKFADAEGNTSYHLTREGVCRAFLHGRGFSNYLNLLDSAFQTTAVFPVSSMGHDAEEGVPYEPWGVMSPVFWILAQAEEQYLAYFNPVSLVVENSSEEKRR